MRTLAFLVAAVLATVWYSSKTILAAWLRLPRRPGGVYDTTGRDWGRVILRAAGVPVAVEGAEHLSPAGPQIVASNHASLFDILAILGHLPVPVKFITKQELFRIPLYGAALKAAGHVRLDRARAREALEVYAGAAKQIVERKLTMLVFPEGTRTRTGALLPFKKGAFVLAIEAGVPIVPAYVANTFGIQPKGSLRVHPRPIRILLGPPILVTGLAASDRDVLADRVRAAIVALKERVDGLQPPA
ncbi:MAG: 1-acyl-sn-glycerol-3-phosphate acyltransferase [Gemmatimonadetes bacterium]|nr:1-acyl-sn-glycerol-3-phosphate acyltransferase [Gemmatimonadota bacterium]